MSPGPTFERVYRALREQLRSGRWPPGAHIEPAALEAELCASITPIRDALHRLVGERLVEAPEHNGFRVAGLTEITFRELLAWSNDVTLLALGSLLPDRTPADALDPEPACVGELLVAISGLSRNLEHWRAMLSINDRLAAVRTVEEQVLDGLAEELCSLKNAAGAGNLRALRHAVGAYHRRRDRAAAHLLGALQPVPRLR